MWVRVRIGVPWSKNVYGRKTLPVTGRVTEFYGEGGGPRLVSLLGFPGTPTL